MSDVQISISGGTVTATGGLSAAGIGGGETTYGGIIDISGGTVTATAVPEVIPDGVWCGAGIGGGGDASGWASITIRGTADVTAEGDPGIGGKWSGGDIIIKESASVRASSTESRTAPGIGIGSVAGSPTGKVSISITSTQPVISVSNGDSMAIGKYRPDQYPNLEINLTVGESAQVWAFNQNTNYPAVDWGSMTIADGTVAVAYTHQNGDFPAAHEQHEVTRSTDGTTWLWQHHLETSQISTFQNDPVMIEIFPEGSTTAAASHTEFYGGNWAYLGTVGQTTAV